MRPIVRHRARAGGPSGKTIPEDLAVESSDDPGVETFNLRDSSGTVRRRTFVSPRPCGAWRISHFPASDFVAPRTP